MRSGLAGIAFGSFGFCIGIVVLLIELLLFLHPLFEFPDRFALCRQLDVGVGCVHFAAGGVAHERHADLLQDAGFHQAGVERVA